MSNSCPIIVIPYLNLNVYYQKRMRAGLHAFIPSGKQMCREVRAILWSAAILSQTAWLGETHINSPPPCTLYTLSISIRLDCLEKMRIALRIPVSLDYMSISLRFFHVLNLSFFGLRQRTKNTNSWKAERNGTSVLATWTRHENVSCKQPMAERDCTKVPAHLL